MQLHTFNPKQHWTHFDQSDSSPSCSPHTRHAMHSSTSPSHRSSTRIQQHTLPSPHKQPLILQSQDGIASYALPGICTEAVCMSHSYQSTPARRVAAHRRTEAATIKLSAALRHTGSMPNYQSTHLIQSRSTEAVLRTVHAVPRHWTNEVPRPASALINAVLDIRNAPRPVSWARQQATRTSRPRALCTRADRVRSKLALPVFVQSTKMLHVCQWRSWPSATATATCTQRGDSNTLSPDPSCRNSCQCSSRSSQRSDIAVQSHFPTRKPQSSPTDSARIAPQDCLTSWDN